MGSTASFLGAAERHFTTEFARIQKVFGTLHSFIAIQIIEASDAAVHAYINQSASASRFSCPFRFEANTTDGRNEGNMVLAKTEVMQLRLDTCITVQLDLSHLGTLFALDSDHDGRISLDDFMKFSALCTKKAIEFQAHEFQMQVRKHDGLTQIKPDNGCPDARPLHTAHVR